MAATQSADYWNGVKTSLTDLVFDYGRSRLIDVEGANDDRNLTDRVDAREGSLTIPGTGVSWVTVAVVGVLVVVGVILVKRVL